MSMDQVSCEDSLFLVGRVVLKRQESRQVTRGGEKITRIQQTADQYILDEKKNGEWLLGDGLKTELGKTNLQTANVERSLWTETAGTEQRISLQVVE